MSLNYTTLQAAILDMALRPDLSTQCPMFVRLAEGMIRREVRAQEIQITLDESDRTLAGRYALPDTVQEVRSIHGTDGSAVYTLENVGMAGIRMLPSDALPLHYALVASSIEFRGIPAADAEFEIAGIGWPEPLATTATNSLLTNHESLYLHGSLVHLYQFTQDLELAQAALSTFTDSVRKVNALAGRKRAGNSTLPAYNFGHIRVGRSY